MSIKDSVKGKLLRAKAHFIYKQLNANCFFYDSDLRHKLYYFLYLSKAYRIIKDCKKLIDEKGIKNNESAIENYLRRLNIHQKLEKLDKSIKEKDQFVNGESLKKLKEMIEASRLNDIATSGDAALKKIYGRDNETLKKTAIELKSYNGYLIKILREEFKKITKALKDYKKPTNDDAGAAYLHEIYEETNNVINKLTSSLLNKKEDGMSIKNFKENLEKLTENLREKLAKAGTISDELAREKTISILNCAGGGSDERLPRCIVDIGSGIGFLTDLKY